MLEHSELNSPDEAGVSADADNLPSIVNDQKFAGINKTALEAKKRVAEKNQNNVVAANQTEKFTSTEIRISDAPW